MSAERDVASLVALGLEPADAAAYAHLARHGPSGARALAAGAGLTRTRAYAVLEALERKGLVEVVLGEPRRFAARPLAAFLDRRAERLEREAHEWRVLRAALTDAFPGLAPDAPGGAGDVTLARGRSEATSRLARAIAHAERDVAWATTPSGLLRLANHQDGEAAMARLAAVTARIVLLASPDDRAGLLDAARAEIPAGVAVAVAPRPDGLADRLVVDGRRALLAYPERDDERAYKGDDLLLDADVPALAADALALVARLAERADG